jgi:hypothetical protein
MRPRATTLKCNSQNGELLEITYKNLMNSVRLVETSCIFLDHFVKSREEARKKLTESIKKRHHVAERVDIKTSVNAINRFGKPNKLYFEEKLPIPKAYASKLNVNDVKTQRSFSSLMTHYNKLIDIGHKKITSNIFRYTEMQETYSNYGLSGTKKEESADQALGATERKPNCFKRISLIINRDKIRLHKTPRFSK